MPGQTPQELNTEYLSGCRDGNQEREAKCYLGIPHMMAMHSHGVALKNHLEANAGPECGSAGNRHATVCLY